MDLCVLANLESKTLMYTMTNQHVDIIDSVMIRRDRLGMNILEQALFIMSSDGDEKFVLLLLKKIPNV